MNGMDYIKIFRGDDSDALGYQTIVGTIKTDLDLTGCRAIFRYLGFFQEFDPIPENGKLTIVIPAQSSRGFPPGVGYASLKVYDPLGKVRTFTNRIPVIVDAMTPMCPCGGNFEVSFSPFPELEPLKIFVGPGAGDFEEYTGFLSKIIDRASLEKYGLAILADTMGEDGGSTGKAASPLAVKAAYDAIIKELTDNYYTAQETDEAIDRVAAYYITYDAAGNPFPTYAALANATTVYSGGRVRVPTRNDYCVVLADETHDNAEYRYIYAVAEGETIGSWQPQFPVEGVMTVDQTVTKNSTNPVAGGGIWSAIWGALSALPTGFTSLYDWVVHQLAGKASTADTTLAARKFSTWTITAVPDDLDPADVYVAWGDPGDFYGYEAWYFALPEGWAWTDNTDQSITSLEYDGFAATRMALGYRLGPDDQANPNRNKPLASEAEAEALRTAVAEKYAKPSGGIPATDLAATVQTSLGKANTALQAHQQLNSNLAALQWSISVSSGSFDDLTINWDSSSEKWVLKNDGEMACYDGAGNAESLSLQWPAADNMLGVDVSATRQMAGWVLGTQNDKPLATAAQGALAQTAVQPVALNAKLDATAAAPAFSSDSSVSYAVGAHCTYNGKLYKCTTATTGGTWVDGSWAEDTMTDPDAVLDITAQNQLRVVAKDGTLLWAQGYDLASTSSATLACDAANNFTFADGATSQAFALPTAPTGKVGDFGLDIDNSANTGAATMTLTGLDTTFSVVVPEGESLNDMLAIAAGELARFYITLSTFRVNNLPTWHIVKQVVENGGAQS